jgi:hypothetical protein
MNRNRILKLTKRVEELTRPSAADAKRLNDQARAAVSRVTAAVPAERAERVREALSAYFRQCRADPNTPVPALAKWICHNASEHRAWFPDPIPVALLDALLDHPEAEVLDGCLHCGLAVPSLRPGGTGREETFENVVPLFDACPHCGGPIRLCGWCEQMCHRLLPVPGAELLAGRDPCKTIPPDNPHRIWDDNGHPL